jgi:formylglycine-generating enzyme
MARRRTADHRWKVLTGSPSGNGQISPLGSSGLRKPGETKPGEPRVARLGIQASIPTRSAKLGESAHIPSNKISSPPTLFEKVLRSFETGGFTYDYVLGELDRLLDIGASPKDLLEVLRRRELIEPLPRDASREIHDLLDAAAARAAEKNVASSDANSPVDKMPEPVSAPIERMSAAPQWRRTEISAKSASGALTSVFERVLSVYESSAFTDADVLSQFRRLLLATGASPTALLEALRRRQLINPLPENAHMQVLGLLNEVMGSAELHSNSPDVEQNLAEQVRTLMPSQGSHSVPTRIAPVESVPPRSYTAPPSPPRPDAKVGTPSTVSAKQEASPPAPPRISVPTPPAVPPWSIARKPVTSIPSSTIQPHSTVAKTGAATPPQPGPTVVRDETKLPAVPGADSFLAKKGPDEPVRPKTEPSQSMPPPASSRVPAKAPVPLAPTAPESTAASSNAAPAIPPQGVTKPSTPKITTAQSTPTVPPASTSSRAPVEQPAAVAPTRASQPDSAVAKAEVNEPVVPKAEASSTPAATTDSPSTKNKNLQPGSAVAPDVTKAPAAASAHSVAATTESSEPVAPKTETTGSVLAVPPAPTSSRTSVDQPASVAPPAASHPDSAVAKTEVSEPVAPKVEASPSMSTVPAAPTSSRAPVEESAAVAATPASQPDFAVAKTSTGALVGAQGTAQTLTPAATTELPLAKVENLQPGSAVAPQVAKPSVAASADSVLERKESSEPAATSSRNPVKEPVAVVAQPDSSVTSSKKETLQPAAAVATTLVPALTKIEGLRPGSAVAPDVAKASVAASADSVAATKEASEPVAPKTETTGSVLAVPSAPTSSRAPVEKPAAVATKPASQSDSAVAKTEVSEPVAPKVEASSVPTATTELPLAKIENLQPSSAVAPVVAKASASEPATPTQPRDLTKPTPVATAGSKPRKRIWSRSPFRDYFAAKPNLAVTPESAIEKSNAAPLISTAPPNSIAAKTNALSRSYVAPPIPTAQRNSVAAKPNTVPPVAASAADSIKEPARAAPTATAPPIPSAQPNSVAAKTSAPNQEVMPPAPSVRLQVPALPPVPVPAWRRIASATQSTISSAPSAPAAAPRSPEKPAAALAKPPDATQSTNSTAPPVPASTQRTVVGQTAEVNANRMPLPEIDAVPAEPSVPAVPAAAQSTTSSTSPAAKSTQTSLERRRAAVISARRVLQEWLSGKTRSAARDSAQAAVKPTSAATPAPAVAPSPATTPSPALTTAAPDEEVTIDFDESTPLVSIAAPDVVVIEPARQRAKDIRSLVLKRGKPWDRGSILRASGIGAAVMVTIGALVSILGRHAPVPAPAATPPLALPEPGTLIRDCAACPGMTVLPSGRFQQGSAGNASPSEKPLHWVLINHPLAMSTNAVTVDEFQQFIDATGRNMQGCDTYDGAWKHRPKGSWKSPGFPQTGTHPVTCTSWNDSVAYAQWLSSKTGHLYRLPSASEWEYAARAGGDAALPWGADGSGACENGNVADESAAHRYPGWSVFGCKDGYVFTAPVGSFKSNAFGLNDMLGNVFQWTNDCWNATYAGAPIDGSARTDGNCADRELRGGSWFSTPAYVRANYRNHFAADYRTSSVGIRLVRDIER